MIYEDEFGKIHTVNCEEGIFFAPESPHKVVGASHDLIKIAITFLPDESSFLYRELTSVKAHKFSISQAVSSCFYEILAETDRHSVFSAVLIKNYVFSIICAIARSAEINEKETEEVSEGGNVKVDIAKQYIKDNKHIFLTCGDVAEQCHFNVKYLNRIFKQETGMTLLEYIHKTKVEEAERLLMTEDYSLEKISHMLGFANEYYFNSFFKRCTGIAPGLFREITKKE